MVIGGFYGGGPTDDVQTIDIKNNLVSAMPSLRRKRYGHACSKLVLDGAEYIVAAGKIGMCIVYRLKVIT